MKILLLVFVIVNIVYSINGAGEICEKCVPKDKCKLYGDMNWREQDRWVNERPCPNPEDEDLGPLFGFAPMAKGDLVCCPDSNIWGLENPTTSRGNLDNRFGKDDLGSRFGNGNYDKHNKPHSREIYSDDGYNQDNLHKKQNSNVNRGDSDQYDDDYDINYEKQRNRWPISHTRPSRPRNNYGRNQPRNNNMNQPYVSGISGLPVFDANGRPIIKDSPNFNGNNFNQPNRPNFNGNNMNQPNRPSVTNPNAVNSRPDKSLQCSVSVLPPNSDSGCCGLDLAAERMFAPQSTYRNRPANTRPVNSNTWAGNTWPGTSNFWENPNGALFGYPKRVTRETPEEGGISFDNRIAGGKTTDLYQFPWTVLLKTTFDYGDRKGTFNCGGSLISSRYVLTAGHCVTEPKARVGNIDVYLAEYDKRTFPKDCIRTPEGQKCIDNVLVHAEDVHVHPNYDDTKLQSDIALIRLRENVPYTEYIRPICLPPINIDNPEYSNLRLAVAGWGRNGSVPSDLKQSTVVNLVPQRQCAASYPQLTKQHVCAAGRTGEDTCKGDSGGPLMMLYEGKYYVSGVVSGKRADAPCGTSVPSLYTNVFQFLPWIRQTIRN